MADYRKDNPQSIEQMFDSIAKSYDRTNAILSFGLHHYWNSTLVNKILNDHKNDIMLDLCCGTGEIAFRSLKKKNKPRKIHLLDFSEEMLSCAQAKAKKNRYEKSALNYIKADAQAVPLRNESIDCVTIAYGIRNVKSPEKCMKEVFRLLENGGSFAILELTRPKNPFLRYFHQIYLKTFLPVLGKLFAANKEAYKYLCQSIHHFVEPEELERLLTKSGFKKVEHYPLNGGIATIIIAKKIL